jgi:hypothetical protein
MFKKEVILTEKIEEKGYTEIRRIYYSNINLRRMEILWQHHWQFAGTI